MRNKFFELLKEKMKKDKTIFLLVADMGLGLVEPFEKEFPDRFLNVGIAEQNMIGVAAGLCNLGFKPVCYTISNFIVHRCFEQIRNDVCLHNYPITLVGVSTGFDNGLLGATHHVIDDYGCMKVFPNMQIYSPSTMSSIKLVIEDVFSNNKPAYIRIGKGNFDIEMNELNGFVKKSNNNILAITYGTILQKIMKDESDIYVMNKLQVTDELLTIILEYNEVFIIEEHMKSTGLHNTICQFLNEKGVLKKIEYVALRDNYVTEVGNRDYLLFTELE